MSTRVRAILESIEAGEPRRKAWGRAVIGKYREMFLVTLCAGLAAYGFIMANVLNNQDNISNTPGGYGAGTALSW